MGAIKPVLSLSLCLLCFFQAREAAPRELPAAYEPPALSANRLFCLGPWKASQCSATLHFSRTVQHPPVFLKVISYLNRNSENNFFMHKCEWHCKANTLCDFSWLEKPSLGFLLHPTNPTTLCAIIFSLKVFLIACFHLQ